MEIDLLQSGVDRLREARDLAGIELGERGELARVQLQSTVEHFLQRGARILPEAAPQAFVGRQQSDDSFDTELTHGVSIPPAPTSRNMPASAERSRIHRRPCDRATSGASERRSGAGKACRWTDSLSVPGQGPAAGL